MLTVKVKLSDKYSAVFDVLEFLQEKNLKSGRDFTFKYHPTKKDNFTHNESERHLEITFYDPKIATWFNLIWN